MKSFKNHMYFYSMAALEALLLLANEIEDIEIFLGVWIFIHASVTLFGMFGRIGDIIETGSTEQIYGLFASRKIEQISDKPSKEKVSFKGKINISSLILLVVNVLIYVLLFV